MVRQVQPTIPANNTQGGETKCTDKKRSGYFKGNSGIREKGEENQDIGCLKKLYF